MGYELQKLMNMFGVSTPTIANYSGTQNPGTAPTAPTAPVLGANPTNFQRAQYAKDLAAYNTANQKYTTDKAAFDENVRKYGLDQAQYDQYRQDYQNRLANTNMYNQAQFSTTGANVPPISQPPAGNVYTPPPVMQQPGTQYGAPQWTDTIKPPDYSSSVANPPAVNTGNNNANLLSLITGNNNAANVPAVNTVNSGTANVPAVNTGNSAIRFLLAALGGNRAATGKDLLAYIDAGNGPGQSRDKAHGGYIKNYATGGAVQGYQDGGLNTRGIAPQANITSRRIYDDPFLEGAAQAIDRADPVNNAMTPTAVVEDPQAALEAMIDRYSVDYGPQIAAATKRRAEEQAAFEKMLMDQPNAEDGSPQSKAELYFRLASAFGAPTKTGNFSENLSLVGQTMAEELAAKAERERADRERKLGVQAELQKMRLQSAGEDLSTLQSKQESEDQYRRDLATEALKSSIEKDPNVQSSAQLPDQSGALLTLRDGTIKVVTAGGDVLTGQAAMDFVKAAQKAYTESQRDIYQARETGKLDAGAAAAAPAQKALVANLDFQIDDLLNDPYLPNMLGPVQSRLPNISGDAARVQSKMDQISGGAFLQARSLLKGGGAITDFESKKAESAFIRMNAAQNEEDFRAAMLDFKDAIHAGLSKLEKANPASGENLGLSAADLQYIGGN